MTRERMEPDWLFMSTAPKIANLPEPPPTCTYPDADVPCERPIYDDGLCKYHRDLVAYRRARARANPWECTCIAGDGAAECDRLDDCLEAWRRGQMVRV